MMKRCALALLAALSVPASAQDQGIQRALIERQQQTDAFTLRLRQSQERVGAPSGDLRRRQEMDARHFSERQQLDNVNQRQLRDVKPDTPAESRPHERQKADGERRAIVAPQ